MLGPRPDSFLHDLKAWRNSEAKHSLEPFYLSFQKHLARISEVEQTLYSVSAPFNEDSNVLPAQCRKAVTSLNELCILIQEFSVSLNPPLQPLSVFTAPICHFLFALQIIDEESSGLITLINSYCSNCINTSSQYALLQRKHISSTFKRLLSYIENILLQTKQFYDETRSYESQPHLAPVDEAAIESADFNFHQSWRYLLEKQDDASSSVEDESSDRKGQHSRILYLEDYQSKRKAAKQALEPL